MPGQVQRLWVGVVSAAILASSCASEPTSTSAPSEAVSSTSIDPTPDATDPDGVEGADPADTESADTEPADTEPQPETVAAEPQARWQTGSSDHIFDQEAVHTYELRIPDDNLARLDADPTAEEYVEGSLSFDGEDVGTVGVRYKGSVGAFLACTGGPNPLRPSGPKTCRKLSMKVKINWDAPKTEFYGLRRLQFHAMNLDPTLMHDRLGYWMFREAGVAAPRSTHARLVINGEYAGLFAMVEQIDGRFTRDRFDDGTGNLYKEVWPFDGNGDITEEDTFLEGLRTNEDDDPDAAIVREFAQEILDAGAAADPDTARSVLGEWTDLDALIAYAVVDRAIAHEDGPFHWYCFETPCAPHNFYWYENPTDRTLHIIPWDLDNAFRNIVTEVDPITPIADEWGEVRNDCEAFAYGAFGLAQRSAACDPLTAAWSSLTDEYEQTRRDLFTGPLALDRLLDQLSTWAEQIRPYVEESAQRFDDAPSVGDWDRALDELADNLTSTLTLTPES